MSVSLGYINLLFGGLSGGSNSLLSTLYGQGQSTNASGQSPVQALQSAELNEPKNIKLTAAQPTVQHAIAAFTAAVTSAKTVAQLLANPAVMKVFLTANGLADQSAYTALATKALTSDLTNPKSLANVLPDARWKTAASTYDFAKNGLSVIKDPKTIATLAKAYAQSVWEQSQDVTTPGLSSALAFRTRAATITSVDQILGDWTMRNVVTTALGIPKEIAFQSLNAQEKAISDRVDIAKFKDPKYVESFVQRFLIANSTNATAPTTPDLTTLANQSRGILV